MTMVKEMVLRTDFQKIGSENRIRKLRRPTKCAGVGEISRALVNARVKASTTGMTKKIINRKTAGLAMPAAAKASRRRRKPPPAGFIARRDATTAVVLVASMVATADLLT